MKSKTLFTWFLHFALGISSGLPLLLTGSTLQAWMTDQHVDLKAIGLFALVGIPYSLKFLWAPFMDRYRLPFLTKRRGWMILTQIFLALSILGLGFTDPLTSSVKTAVFALLVSFMSASQDVVIDAYRTESLIGNELGLATSSYITGYRVGMLVAGAGSLLLVGEYQLSWQQIYALMASMLSVGVVAALFAPEVKTIAHAKTLKEAVIVPFVEFFTRPQAFWVFAFILFYKFGDNLAGAMTTPFILKMGYTKVEYALVAKGAGFFAVIAGGVFGGPLMLRLGIVRSLWIFGIGQAIAVAGFALLASVDHHLNILSLVIVSENFFIGCGAAAFTAFLSSITNKKFSATQFALLTALMSVSRSVLSAPSGWLAEKLGWVEYFLMCVVLAVPGLLLLLKIQDQIKKREASPEITAPESET
jgi:PAT family beta-lactamase induction signal transducer AmpG